MGVRPVLVMLLAMWCGPVVVVVAVHGVSWGAIYLLAAPGAICGLCVAISVAREAARELRTLALR
jgi:hypothetical protein